MLIDALYDGVARAARDWLVGFLHDCKPADLGAALATVPRLQKALARLRSTLAYFVREADRRAKGAHPGMMRFHDDELADVMALLRRELGDGVSDRPEATPEPVVR